MAFCAHIILSRQGIPNAIATTKAILGTYHEHWIQDAWFQLDEALGHWTGIPWLGQKSLWKSLYRKMLPEILWQWSFVFPLIVITIRLLLMWLCQRTIVKRWTKNHRLKSAATSVIRSIPVDQLKQVILEIFELWPRFATSSDGKHLEKLIFDFLHSIVWTLKIWNKYIFPF